MWTIHPIYSENVIVRRVQVRTEGPNNDGCNPDSSRNVLVGAMERCRTGVRRIRGMMPEDVTVAHKTGTLNNTSSDIGIITGPDGHAIAVAIYSVNEAATATDDTYSVNEDAVLTVPAAGVLANDMDVDGDALGAVDLGEAAGQHRFGLVV